MEYKQGTWIKKHNFPKKSGYYVTRLVNDETQTTRLSISYWNGWWDVDYGYSVVEWALLPEKEKK